jgi:surface antigen
MNLKKLITTCSVITVLSASALPAYAGDNLLGGLIGAAGGAAVGSNIGKGKGNIAAIAVGTLLGAGLGSQIGSGPAYATNYNSNNYYEDNNWNNGHHYGHHKKKWKKNHHNYYRNTYYQPEHTYYQTQVIEVSDSQPEQYCREFNQGITVGGKVQAGYGTACLQPDGSWQIQR